MITRKYDRTYTKSELDSYLGSVQTADIDEAIRELGYINASVFKGYGALTDDEAAYNAMVYDVKEKALDVLVRRSDDVAYDRDNYVLYFRLSNGIQVSFHLNYRSESFRNYQFVYLLFARQACSIDWDGVLNSYTYTDVELYQEKCREYKRRVKDSYDKKDERRAAIIGAMKSYFSHWTRRKMYGIKMSYSDLKDLHIEDPSFYHDCMSKEDIISVVCRVFRIDFHNACLAADRLIGAVIGTKSFSEVFDCRVSPVA